MKTTLNHDQVYELLEAIDHRIDDLQELEASVGTLARRLEVAVHPLDQGTGSKSGLLSRLMRESGMPNNGLRYREMSDDEFRDVRYQVARETQRRESFNFRSIPCDGLTKKEITEIQTQIDRILASRTEAADY